MGNLTETVVLLVGGCGLIVVGLKEIITGYSMPTGFVPLGIDSPGFHVFIGAATLLAGFALLTLLCSIREKAAAELVEE